MLWCSLYKVFCETQKTNIMRADRTDCLLLDALGNLLMSVSLSTKSDVLLARSPPLFFLSAPLVYGRFRS